MMTALLFRFDKQLIGWSQTIGLKSADNLNGEENNSEVARPEKL
jgi:hypothetical protein